MSNMSAKADQQSQGWPWALDVAGAVGCLIVAILLVLAWANVPA